MTQNMARGARRDMARGARRDRIFFKKNVFISKNIHRKINLQEIFKGKVSENRLFDVDPNTIHPLTRIKFGTEEKILKKTLQFTIRILKEKHSKKTIHFTIMILKECCPASRFTDQAPRV